MFLLSVVCNQTYHSENKYFRWDDADVRFALYIVPTCLILFYSASSLKQPVSRHIAPLRHISLIPSQTSLCCYSIILRALIAEKLQISLISVYERERWRVKQYIFLSTLLRWAYYIKKNLQSNCVLSASTSFTELSDPVSSFLSTLRNSSIISSNLFGRTE